jgi:hypothetical protein
MSQSQSSTQPPKAQPVSASRSRCRLTINHLGIRHISPHHDYDRASRHLITFVINADLYLHAQRRDTDQQCYTLLDVAGPHQRNPRMVGHAIVEMLCCSTYDA